MRAQKHLLKILRLLNINKQLKRRNCLSSSISLKRSIYTYNVVKCNGPALSLLATISIKTAMVFYF